MTASVRRPDAAAAAARAAEVLRRWAAAVDRESRFPVESLRALRESGLNGLLVPRELGGWGASCTTFLEVARVLGAECLSSALVWVMHCQQAAAIASHGRPELRREVLPEVAGGRLLLAGVTSEAGAGGLLSVSSPAVRRGDDVCFEREAPFVTSGAQADAYVMTLRAGPDAQADEAVLLYVRRDQAEVEVTAPWVALGMRGTQSVTLRLTGRAPSGQVLDAAGYRDAVLLTMVPIAHLGWSAAWLGAAAEVVRRLVPLLRRRIGGGGGARTGDPALARLARVRLRMDAAGCLLWSVAREYQRADAGALRSPGFQVRVNEVKVLASETAHAVVDEAMDLAGVTSGYTVNDRIPLERVYRDLRAARLMYSNDRLIEANGRLALLDTSLGSEFA